MKKILIIVLAITTCYTSYAQNGEIISNENGVSVLKVWGTHPERGYAQGY